MWPTQRIPGITLAKSKNCWHQIWITKLKFLADEMFNYVWRENKGCLSSSFDCGKFECVLCCEYLTPPTDPSLWTVIALWGWAGYLGDTLCLIFAYFFLQQINKFDKHGLTWNEAFLLILEECRWSRRGWAWGAVGDVLSIWVQENLRTNQVNLTNLICA